MVEFPKLKNSLSLSLPMLMFFYLTLVPLTVLGQLEFGTYFEWFLKITLLILMGYWWRKYVERSEYHLKPIKIYLYLILFYIMVSIFSIETYFDAKGLIYNSYGLLTIILVFASTNPNFVRKLLRTFIWLIIPLALIFFIFCQDLILDSDAVGVTVIPICLLLLMLPKLPWHIKLSLILLALFFSLIDLGARSTVIKLAVPIFIWPYYFLISHINYKIRKFTTNILASILILMPIVFLWMGVSGSFNIFTPKSISDSNIRISEKSGKDIVETDLKSDTRTFIYVEALASAIVKDSFIWGITPGRGYISDAFGGNDLNGRNERFRSEVGIVNIFTWFGLFGLTFFYFLFVRGSYLAINKSQNSLSMLFGLYNAFNLSYSWVENYTEMNMSNVAIWVCLGMCYSSRFREMSNIDFKKWAISLYGSRKLI